MKKVSIISAIICCHIAGCTAVQQAKIVPNDPDFAPIMPELQEEPIVPTGSLFNVNYVNNIYSDSKARRVGDIINVVLSESTNAQKNAKTELKKEADNTLDPIIGLGGNATFKGDSIQFGVSQSNNHKGDSKSNQGNSLRGNISVHVLRVLPNGNLIIRGEKWLTLNSGDEYIRLTGVIRDKDISADNTIKSTKVANARIQYSGTGSFSDIQNPGWLSQFFNSGWWPI